VRSHTSTLGAAGHADKSFTPLVHFAWWKGGQLGAQSISTKHPSEQTLAQVCWRQDHKAENKADASFYSLGVYLVVCGKTQWQIMLRGGRPNQSAETQLYLEKRAML
jgi:hypothetical protein